MTFIAETISYW